MVTHALGFCFLSLFTSGYSRLNEERSSACRVSFLGPRGRKQLDTGKTAWGASWCETDGTCETCGGEHKCLQGFGEEARRKETDF